MNTYKMVKRKKEISFSEEEIPKILLEIEREVGKLIVGQSEIIRGIMISILSGGHVLLEGVPGVAKTLLISALSKVLGCNSKRVQFTVDLLPTDITGIVTFNEKQKDFEVMKGPIFTNILIADEINRSPPKTQSALLEAMQERRVSIAKVSYDLPAPFFVMATENPLEHNGVYSLPEAQIDRFLFKLLVPYPDNEEEEKILESNISIKNFEDFDLKPILNPHKIIDLQKKVREVYSSQEIKNYIVRLVSETRNKNHSLSKYILFGCSPRASISLYIASKAEALLCGRNYVLPADVRAVIYPILRHRLILSFEAEVDKITPDEIIKNLLKNVTTL
jgi:MoxR-like ATPase